eukprot:TRINITY_DN3061_c0_g1_i5.p1 TRINITY_DN3061_c0_g1~~TRINITY_DN3061_c0_g1_i5.p1  ORF type:complete len:1256 (+),score=226.83 TRINITY_DN3061_c0_g1_i5:45-3812(+)
MNTLSRSAPKHTRPETVDSLPQFSFSSSQRSSVNLGSIDYSHEDWSLANQNEDEGYRFPKDDRRPRTWGKLPTEAPRKPNAQASGIIEDDLQRFTNTPSTHKSSSRGTSASSTPLSTPVFFHPSSTPPQHVSINEKKIKNEKKKEKRRGSHDLPDIDHDGPLPQAERQSIPEDAVGIKILIDIKKGKINLNKYIQEHASSIPIPINYEEESETNQAPQSSIKSFDSSNNSKSPAENSLGANGSEVARSLHAHFPTSQKEDGHEIRTTNKRASQHIASPIFGLSVPERGEETAPPTYTVFTKEPKGNANSPHFSILRPFTAQLKDPNQGVVVEPHPVPVWAGLSGNIDVLEGGRQSRWLSLDEGVITMSKKAHSSSFIFTKSITEVTWSHLCDYVGDASSDEQEFQISLDDVFSHYTLIIGSPEEMDMWMGALNASKIQQLICYYNSTRNVSFADYIEFDELDIFEAALRPLMRTWWNVATETLQNCVGLLAEVFRLNPLQQDVSQRIVRAGSWSFTCQLLVHFKSEVGKHPYYGATAFFDDSSFFMFKEREHDRLNYEITQAHHRCAPELQLLALDNKFLKTDYHTYYRTVHEKLIFQESISRKSIERNQNIGFVGQYGLSTASRTILDQFANFYGISENFQNLSTLDMYTRHICDSVEHLEVIAMATESLVSRVRSGSTIQCKDYHLTVHELSGLQKITDHLLHYTEQRLLNFMVLYPSCEPKGCVKLLLRIMLQTIHLSCKVENGEASAADIFHSKVNDCIKEAASKIIKHILDSSRDKFSQQNWANQLTQVLTPPQYLYALQLCSSEFESLKNFVDEFPSGTNIHQEVAAQLFSSLCSETFFTANEYGSSHVDPMIVFNSVSSWKKLRLLLSPYLVDQFDPPPLDALFEKSIIFWIEDSATNNIQHIEKACQMDAYLPIEYAQISTSLVDAFSAIVQPVIFLQSSLEADALYNTRENGYTFIEYFVLKSVSLITRYLDILEAKFLEVLKEPNMQNVLKERKLTVILNNMYSCQEKFSSFENSTLVEQSRYFQISMELSREHMPSTRLDDLVSEFYPKIKKKAFMLLSKLVEIKWQAIASDFSLDVKRHIDTWSIREIEAAKIHHKKTYNTTALAPILLDLDKVIPIVGETIKPDLQAIHDAVDDFRQTLLPDLFMPALKHVWKVFTKTIYMHVIVKSRSKTVESLLPLAITQEALLSLATLLHQDGEGLARKYYAQFLGSLADIVNEKERTLTGESKDRTVLKDMIEKLDRE